MIEEYLDRGGDALFLIEHVVVTTPDKPLTAEEERPDLLEAGYDLTPEAQHRLKAEIRSTIAQRPLDEWQAIFAARDLCVEPVLTTEEACAHPQALARDMVVEVSKPGGGTQRQIGAPIKFSASKPTYRHIGVAKGKHTGEVMAGLVEPRH